MAQQPSAAQPVADSTTEFKTLLTKVLTTPQVTAKEAETAVANASNVAQWAEPPAPADVAVSQLAAQLYDASATAISKSADTLDHAIQLHANVAHLLSRATPPQNEVLGALQVCLMVRGTQRTPGKACAFFYRKTECRVLLRFTLP